MAQVAFTRANLLLTFEMFLLADSCQQTHRIRSNTHTNIHIANVVYQAARRLYVRLTLTVPCLVSSTGLEPPGLPP